MGQKASYFVQVIKFAVIIYNYENKVVFTCDPGGQKENFMRGGYRGIPKPKLPHHLKRVHVNARIQKWMLDELKKQGEVGIVLEYILERKAGFKYQPEMQNKN